MTKPLVPAAAARAGHRSSPRISVVIPARDEAARIGRALARIFAAVRSPCELIVVVDSADDPTWEEVQACAAAEPRLRCLVSGYGPGPGSAIRYGIDHARAGVVVVTMADNSDDPRQIEALAALVEGGAAVAAASRYSRGGGQIGGPIVKSLLSRLAGRSLHLLAGAGTKDATNSFKAYSAAFVRDAGIDSRQGFAIGIELTAKARRMRRPVAELPTIWLERQDGQSGFRLLAWLPSYLRWYLFCFGRALTADQVAARCARHRQAEAASGQGPARDQAQGPARDQAQGPAQDEPVAATPGPGAVVRVPAQRPATDWAAWHVITHRDTLTGAAGTRGAA